jgi:hypothetical protein
MRDFSIKPLLICFVIVISFVIGACSKRSTSTPPSSEKNLNGVTFKAADNAGLAEDFNGTITGDSMKIKMPGNVSLNGLIPTINFAGASISPANRTPQNFTNPVTYTITAQDGSTRNYTFHASYRTHSDTLSMITAKWGVIKDSVTNMNFTYPNGLYPNPGVYFGVSADYYDFNSNGTVYVVENNNSASQPYQVLSNGRISFIIFTNYNYECAIQYLSPTRMTLFWFLTSSNGGQYTRTLYLKK